uniref:uncharacterized protein LOC120348514 n=1 Tax=Styela clava TaxID=7725 RepID=UPI00193980F1|nr:uncharacterized protein LOC120348514 [Styela clava]
MEIFVKKHRNTEKDHEFFTVNEPLDGGNRWAMIGCMAGKVLIQHGVITEAMKLRMVEEWASTEFVSEKQAKITLICEALRFIGYSPNNRDNYEFGEDSTFECCAICTVRIIPNDSWMRFVRLYLKLSEDVIERVKLEGKLTEEQKLQIANFAISN